MGTPVKRWGSKSTPTTVTTPSVTVIPPTNDPNNPLDVFNNMQNKADSLLSVYTGTTEKKIEKPIPYMMVPGAQAYYFKHGLRHPEKDSLIFVFEKKDSWPNDLFMVVVTTKKDPTLIKYHGVTENDPVQSVIATFNQVRDVANTSLSYANWMMKPLSPWPFNKVPLSPGWLVEKARTGIPSLDKWLIKQAPPSVLALWQSQLRAFVPTLTFY